MHLLKVFTHDKRYAEIESEIIQKSVKGEPISMCEFGIAEAQLLEKGYLQNEIDKAKEKLCV